jgi:hypothetical protein
MLSCPACNAPRDEQFAKCPKCDRFWVVPDTQPRTVPAVPSQLRRLWETSRMCAEGFKRADAILAPASSLQQGFRRLLSRSLVDADRRLTTTCLSSLEKIIAFRNSANVADLNAAWKTLVPAVVKLKGHLDDIEMAEQLAENEGEGKGPEATR